jgi:hypothetical protein
MNSAWRIMADFFIRSGGFEHNRLATLVRLESHDGLRFNNTNGGGYAFSQNIILLGRKSTKIDKKNA